MRWTPSWSGQITGEPEKPSALPVASTAGPETRTRISGAGGRRGVIDQPAVPDEARWLELRFAAEAAAAIRRLAVRGAPLIGVVAGWALAVELERDPAGLERAAAQLRAARPTAVNLA